MASFITPPTRADDKTLEVNNAGELQVKEAGAFLEESGIGGQHVRPWSLLPTNIGNVADPEGTSGVADHSEFGDDWTAYPLGISAHYQTPTDWSINPGDLELTVWTIVGMNSTEPFQIGLVREPGALPGITRMYWRMASFQHSPGDMWTEWFPLTSGVAGGLAEYDVVEALVASLAEPSGIATLGGDGILAEAQRPPAPSGVVSDVIVVPGLPVEIDDDDLHYFGAGGATHSNNAFVALQVPALTAKRVHVVFEITGTATFHISLRRGAANIAMTSLSSTNITSFPVSDEEFDLAARMSIGVERQSGAGTGRFWVAAVEIEKETF